MAFQKHNSRSIQENRDTYAELILDELRTQGSVKRARDVVHPAAVRHAKIMNPGRCNTDRLMAGRIIFGELVIDGKILLKEGEYRAA